MPINLGITMEHGILWKQNAAELVIFLSDMEIWAENNCIMLTGFKSKMKNNV